MKKIMSLLLTIILAASMAACSPSKSPGQTETPSAEAATAQTSAQESTEQSKPTPEATQDPKKIVYEFEFTDLDGNVHKLSDYKGKPVYLRVWASWCSVCLSSLESLDKLAGENNDFAVLSVVMPDLDGEKSAEDFKKWYKDLGYKNLTVLLDPEGQIAYDFGINAFPSQIMFDGEGHIVYGFVGLMETDMIKQTMEDIAKGKTE